MKAMTPSKIHSLTQSLHTVLRGLLIPLRPIHVRPTHKLKTQDGDGPGVSS